ncbi:hypothetical protein Q1695_004909 [Nippostrongylus brasiliensis]|nr:hypothetical protein Q1695_004909 [Nippostrongylus brasiliensis]
MHIITSAVRLASRVGGGASRQYGFMASNALRDRRPSTGEWQVASRATTTGAFHSLDKLVIEDPETALEVAARLTRDEQLLLREALDDLAAREDIARSRVVPSRRLISKISRFSDVNRRIRKSGAVPMTDEQTKSLFLINALPFIGFGFLDNMIMIIAGNYIDQKLGTLLCLSTMAAAGLGNLISDVAGVGLAHYVESIFHKIGLKHPVLTAEQLDSPKARWTTHSARAAGLTIGCLIGMFPLLFIDADGEDAPAKPPPSQKS